MKKVFFVLAAAACMVACNKPTTPEAEATAEDTVVVEEVSADSAVEVVEEVAADSVVAE